MPSKSISVWHSTPRLASACGAAEIRQVDDEGRADDLGTQPAQQLDRGLRRAAGGDQIVDQQHGLAGLQRILVDLDDVDAVFELVVLADGLAPAACPSCGSARSRSAS